MKSSLAAILGLCVLFVSPHANAQPKNPPKNQTGIFMSANGLTPASPKGYWVYKKAVCCKMGFPGKVEVVPPGKYDIRVGFASGYLVHEAEVKPGEKYVIPTGLFTFKEVTPPSQISSVPQELYSGSGDTYLATGYQGTTVRLLPGKYTVCYQDPKSEKPSESFSSWQVVGVFPSPNPMKGYNTEYPPEKETSRDFNRTYPVPGGAARRWQKLEDAPGVSLIDALPPNDWGAAYAVSCLDSETDKPVQLVLNHRTGIKVWLNGQLTTEVPPRQNVYYAVRQTFFAQFKKGRNELLVKTQRTSYDWPLSVVAVYCKTYETEIKAEVEAGK